MKWIKNSLLFHIFLLIAAAAVAYASFYMVRQAVSLYRESMANQRKIEQLAQRKRELEAYLEHLQTPGAIEQQARERLNLKLPGEQVVVVLAKKADDMQKQTERAGERFWKWLFEWLGRVK